MDSRDSSSVAATNRETVSSSEDDGSLSVTAALAKEAVFLFQSGKFADCRKVLNQLLQKKEGDPKVLHNIAIVENFQEGFSNPKKFLEVLNNVKKCSEELAHASGEHVEAVSDSASNAMIGTNGNNAMAHKSSVTSSSTIVLNGEFSTYVALFNIAVTWFHLHEYSNSFSILEPLYQKIAPINEGIALRICLLLLDVALLSHHAPLSADVINYVEKVSCVSTLTSQGDNGSAAQQQSSNLLTKTSSITNNTPIPDVSASASASSSNASESPLSRSLSEEAEYENFFSTLDSSGQNLPRPSVLHSTNNLARTQFDDSFSIIDLRLKLHLYKVRFLLLTRNAKAAKREVKMAMNIARGKEYSMALFLKSQLEYARGNHRKAIKLLMASSNLTEMATSIMYYNNLGCIYYRLGQHQTSTVFFSKALSGSSSLRKEKPQSQTTFSQDKSLLIVYNCGVQYLACGKPKLAARCFHKASLIFYNRPLLWLRIAECCLMALEKGLLESCGAPSSRPEVRVHVVGKGKWRNLVMEDGVSRNGQVDSVGWEDSFLGDDRQPKLSMHLARQCLLNALHLLNFSESMHLKSGLPSNLALEEERVSSKNTTYKSASGGDSQAHIVAVGSQVSANGELKEQKSGNTLNATLQSSISDYEDICRKENQMIRLSVLADLAFVEFELGNPLKALSTVRALLKVPECSRVYRFLGNMYAAEALCLLNRSKEAAEHLLIYLSSGNNFEHPYTQEDCELWQVEKTVDWEESNGGPVAANTSSVNETQGFALLNPEEARGTLYANLAAMSATQGDLDQANRFVIQALSVIPNSLGAVLTAIYLDLMLGKPYEAIAKLKQCSRIRFLSSIFSVNGSS